MFPSEEHKNGVIADRRLKKREKKNTYTDKLDIIDVVWTLCIRKEKKMTVCTHHVSCSLNCWCIRCLLSKLCSLFSSRIENVPQNIFHIYASSLAFNRGSFYLFRFALLFAYFFPLAKSKCFIMHSAATYKGSQREKSLCCSIAMHVLCACLDTNWHSPLFASTYFEAQHFFLFFSPSKSNGEKTRNCIPIFSAYENRLRHFRVCDVRR